MGERVSTGAVVLLLVHVCVWTSRVAGDLPHTAQARLSPKDSDAIVFVEDHDHKHPLHDRKPPASKPGTEAPKIPLDLIQRLNSIENVTQLRNLLDADTLHDYDDPDSEIGNRFGSDDERKAAVVPKPGTCAPELVSIQLQNEDDRNIFYYPQCTRVERCGGCCSHDLLSCQPTDTEMITFQVIETKYEGGTSLKYKGKKFISVEQHTKCKCDCKIKEEHCNKMQRYEAGECNCVCQNVDEENKCLAENDTKIWDSKECACSCRFLKECSTGFYFDQKTCNCSPIPIIRRRVSESNMDLRLRGNDPRLKYKITPQGVVPLNKVADKDIENN